MALLSFGDRAGSDAQYAMRALLVGEAVKVALVIVLFVVVLKLLKVSPGALFAAYDCAADIRRAGTAARAQRLKLHQWIHR